MSAQQITCEGVLESVREMFREIRLETSREIQETSRRIQETSREIQETSRLIKEQGAEFDRLMKEQAAEFDRRMRVADLRIQETDRQLQETDLQIKRTSKEVGNITGSMGRVIEHMVAGDNIIGKFKKLGYIIGDYYRNKKFGRDLPEELDARGEIDMFLENGDIAILIEVKTTMQTKDVYQLMRTLERFRRCADYKKDKRRFIGAIAGAVVEDDAIKFAHENGLYTIVQSGESVEILPMPEGFKAREW